MSYGRRRIRFTRTGAAFAVGTLAVGYAAINTGNNLLYLLLGAMLGLIALSGWLSEQALKKLTVERGPLRGTPVGKEAQIHYLVRNGKRRLPSYAVEIMEQGLMGHGFVARVAAGETAEARSSNRFVRRGTYPLDTITLSTTFPFGLFRKERDLRAPAELVIWPRTDRRIRPPVGGGGRRPRPDATVWGAPGSRGEYRGLREYRLGDDTRDIHWRSSARHTVPVVKEYERDAAQVLWVCLDLGAEPGDAAEEMVEVAAALAASAVAAGRRFGLVAGEFVSRPGSGPSHLESILDALARVDFDVRKPTPSPPVSPSSCVLVSLYGRDRTRFGEHYIGRGHVAPPVTLASPEAPVRRSILRRRRA